MQRGVGVADDRQLAVHRGADRRHPEQLQCRAVDAGEVNVLGDLQGVVHALGQFGHLGDQRVEAARQPGESAGRQQDGRGAAPSHQIVHAWQLVIQQLVVVAHFQ